MMAQVAATQDRQDLIAYLKSISPSEGHAKRALSPTTAAK